MKHRCKCESASLEELTNKGKLTSIMDIMNNNIFSLLGGFNEFGYLFAVPCCQVGIGKEMAYRKIEELLIKQKNCEVVQVQPSSKRIGAEKVKNML